MQKCSDKLSGKLHISLMFPSFYNFYMITSVLILCYFLDDIFDQHMHEIDERKTPRYSLVVVATSQCR
jgi:hypothetical protein